MTAKDPEALVRLEEAAEDLIKAASHARANLLSDTSYSPEATVERIDTAIPALRAALAALPVVAQPAPDQEADAKMKGESSEPVGGLIARPPGALIEQVAGLIHAPYKNAWYSLWEGRKPEVRDRAWEVICLVRAAAPEELEDQPSMPEREAEERVTRGWLTPVSRWEWPAKDCAI